VVRVSLPFHTTTRFSRPILCLYIHLYTMAYVPPSKRLGFVIKPEDKPPWTAFRPKATTHDEDSLSHLVPIFNASQVGTFNVFTHRSPLTVPLGPEDNDQPRPSDSLPYHAPHPLGHLIANIMIFERGQPLWESGAELWSHTVSEIMVDDWKAGKLNFDRPIPVFYGTSTRLDRFEFRGWWLVNSRSRSTLAKSTDTRQENDCTERSRV